MEKLELKRSPGSIFYKNLLGHVVFSTVVYTFFDKLLLALVLFHSRLGYTYSCLLSLFYFLVHCFTVLFSPEHRPTGGLSHWTPYIIKIVFTTSIHFGLQFQVGHLNQGKEIQWICTGLENFDIYFGLLFDCYCQILISGRETGRRTMFSPKSRIS